MPTDPLQTPSHGSILQTTLGDVDDDFEPAPVAHELRRRSRSPISINSLYRAVDGQWAVHSFGSRGDSYDDALAESVNGLYKAEVVHRQSWRSLSWRSLVTAEWVQWWNERRLHTAIDDLPPAEYGAGTISNTRPSRPRDSKPSSLHRTQGNSVRPLHPNALRQLRQNVCSLLGYCRASRKAMLAAIGHELILQGHPVLWTPTAALVQELLAAKRDLACQTCSPSWIAFVSDATASSSAREPARASEAHRPRCRRTVLGAVLS